MLWKITKWLGALCLALFALVFIVLPLVANTEQGRAQLEQVLSRALQRDVKIGKLNIGLFYASIDVEQLAIANPEGYPEQPFLKAGKLDLDTDLAELLDGRVQGRVKGRGLDLLIQRKGDGTNLDGIGGESSEGGGEGPDLDLGLELLDSRLTVEDLDKQEKLVLEGVSVFMRLTNAAGQKDAKIKIKVSSVTRDALSVRDLEIDARHAGEWLELDKLTGLLPGDGKLEGSGRLRVQGGDHWAAKLDAKGVRLDADLVPVAAALFPFAAKAGGQIDGTLDASFNLSGAGLTWKAMKPTLNGGGRATLTGLTLPGESLLAMLLQQAGKGTGAIDLNDAGAEFNVSDGWLKFNRLSARSKEARYDLAGRVSLEGKLELEMDLLPLVKLYGGGDTYKDVQQYVDKLPFRIGGTTAAPKLKGPNLDEIARNAMEKKLGNDLEKELGGLLEKLKKNKK